MEGRGEVEFAEDDSVFGYNVVPLLEQSGIPVGKIVNFQDLTELYKLSEKLKQADRLAAVGRLAAGLAHEVRNPLASVRGSIQEISESFAVGSSNRKLCEIVINESDRLDSIITEFLQFARPAPNPVLPIRLHLLCL